MTRAAPDRLIILARRAAAVAAVVALVAGCGDDDDSSGSPEQGTAPNQATTTPPASKQLDRVVKVDGDRGLYVQVHGDRVAHSDHGGRRRGHE